MSIDIKVPGLPESITEATVSTWYKKPGEFIKRDEQLVDIETDKVVLEVVAPKDGVLEKIVKETGTVVKAGEVIGLFNDEAKQKTADEKKPDSDVKETKKSEVKQEPLEGEMLSPSMRRLKTEKALEQAKPSSDAGKKEAKGAKETVKEGGKEAAKEEATQTFKAETQKISKEPMMPAGERLEKRVPMTRLRARIAERLVEAQHTAAMLTTFNEINMTAVMELRKKYKELFEKSHGVKLGLMSFFTHAVVEALKNFPAVNASIDGTDIVYHGYYDIGIAVSTPRGLVVPIIRDADKLTMAEIEKKIADLAKRAQTGHLTMEEITGGTFTITNGGVFGSLMATPIINPPQTAILGMHKIQERPIAENGLVVIRPMMYVALSYDHRLIDGAESVRFLVTVKEFLEDPARLALGL